MPTMLMDTGIVAKFRLPTAPTYNLNGTSKNLIIHTNQTHVVTSASKHKTSIATYTAKMYGRTKK